MAPNVVVLKINALKMQKRIINTEKWKYSLNRDS